jgi:hypothetical protein
MLIRACYYKNMPFSSAVVLYNLICVAFVSFYFSLCIIREYLTHFSENILMRIRKPLT